VDAFFALASIVADEMYARPVPIVALSPEDFASLRNGDEVEVREEGEVYVRIP
jgi:predicted aconitase with swiveling domain